MSEGVEIRDLIYKERVVIGVEEERERKEMMEI